MSKYNVLYIYDIIPKNPENLNRIKRKFYYRLQKLFPAVRRATKSALLTTREHEKYIDEFFLAFEGDVIVYKCKLESIEILGQKL